MTEHQEQPTQEKRNPWGNTNQTKNPETQTIETKSSLHSIMKEQQQETDAIKEIDIMKEVNEDEAMRLAVEASLLYEINSKKSEIKDDDLNLAIQLSLNDSNKKESCCLKDDSKYQEEDELKLAMELSLNDKAKSSTVDNTQKEEHSTNSSEVPLKDDPAYANYFLMKNMNVDLLDIKKLMRLDGMNENILDLDPDKPLNSQLLKSTKNVDASYEIALQLQREEDSYYAMVQHEKKSARNDVNSVKTVSRYEFEKQKQAQDISYKQQQRNLDIEEEYDDYDEDYEDTNSGFRLNSNTNSNASNNIWKRDKSNYIIGPNGERRTKHDIELKHISNAQRLSYNDKNNKATTSVSDNAYNSLNQKLKRYVNKGVATHGHGKSESYDDKTRGGVLDASVRLILQKAINNGFIRQVNGVVSEGKEAIVYHGDDTVAIKVFKRIQEFRNRGEYVDGDVRYYDKPFSKIDKRQQVELWAEKEYRNLIRANRAYIPTPKPIYQKQNVVIMFFLGTEDQDSAWPAPKLKDISLKFGSSKWIHFYCLIMTYIKKLYHVANLIHADLSEYNVLIVPSSQIQYASTTIIENKNTNPQEEDTLTIAFIDFGQAVDASSHPKAMEYLRRDLERISSFFSKVGGVSVLSLDVVLQFIMDFEYEEESNDDWEFTGSGSDYDKKVEEQQCNPNDLDANDEEEEYILISKEEQLKDGNGKNSYNKKGCFRKLNKWDDEVEYECILKKVVV